MAAFITFQVFNQADRARELVDLLESKQIPYEVEDSNANLPLLSSDIQLTEIKVTLRQEDFNKADAMLEAIAINNLKDIPSDHYLLSFSDEELLEIVEKPDEWNKNDFVLAQKLLRDRGKEVSPAELAEIAKNRMASLAKPEQGQKGWILFAYLLAVLGSPLGAWIGWHIMAFKKKLPDGKRVYAYNTTDRKHGERIFVLGLVFVLLWLLASLKIYNII
jgi:hypothetical protein